MHHVLHIMPHMGPGVGKAVSSVAISAVDCRSCYRHKILLLERPYNFNYINKCREKGVEVFWTKDHRQITDLLRRADIVQLEWWHHPLVLGFLDELSKIRIRLCFWAHISGCNYPVIPASLINLASHFFFTTAYSYENPFWTESEREKIRLKSTIAVGAGGIENVSGACTKPHSGFNVGYVGTLDFRKLHPDFVDFCETVNLSDVRFIMVGNDEKKDSILGPAKAKGLEDRFEFTGFSENVKQEFERFDMFGYLLNPEHYGTTDNVLLEAMGAKMPIIVLNQCGEKHIIEHMKTGLLVDSKEEYGQAVRYLYANPKLRNFFGHNAEQAVKKKFTPQITMQTLHDQYDHILKLSKRYHTFKKIFGVEPYQWFICGLGKERPFFEKWLGPHNVDPAYLKEQICLLKEIFKGARKSSIYHFYSYYPFDAKLILWNNHINNKGGQCVET